MLNIKRVIASAPRKPEHVVLRPLTTPWSEQAASSGEVYGEAAREGSGDTRYSRHPHPQLEREHFQLLNGWWDYCIVPVKSLNTSAAVESAIWLTAPIPSEWDGRILVPFSPEAPLSNVNRQLEPDELLWYRRSFACPPELFVPGESQGTLTGQQRTGNRCILHFEAVDYACACYCNGALMGTHQCGYLPFSFDVTDTLLQGKNEIALCVYDPSETGVQLRGKQRRERGGIWYTAQSGIWQTVWLEVVPERHIESLLIETEPDTGGLVLTISVRNCAGRNEDVAVKGDAEAGATLAEKGSADAGADLAAKEGANAGANVAAKGGADAGVSLATIEGASVDTAADADSVPDTETAANPDTDLSQQAPLQLTVKLFDGDTLLGTAFSVTDAVTHTLTLNIAKPHLWSPDDPYLYGLELTYGSDRVTSYCALRTITMEDDERGFRRLCINHEPCFLRGVLDQGYWPDGLMTAPTDDALIFDILTMKSLGFNMLRKHIKIESDRWYYHCDRLGMLVWQDMVSGGTSPKPWCNSYLPTFFRWSWNHYSDASHHYHNLSADSEAYRAEWTATCANAIRYLGNHPSIITWVLFNEAWGQFDTRKATDMVRALDPSRPVDAVSGWFDQACGDFQSVHNYFRPLEVYEDPASPKRAFVVSEFGGHSYHIPEHSPLATSYGYESFASGDAFRTAVRKSLAEASDLEQHGLAGFVYTQLSDVEEETNGLLTYDRFINKLDDKDYS